MREMLVAALDAAENDATVRAIVTTDSGDRALGAGQDLNETKTFDADRTELWIGEWERLYDRIRSLSKPLVMALNGLPPSASRAVIGWP